MIEYADGPLMLLQRQGSVFPRALLLTLPSICITVTLLVTGNEVQEFTASIQENFKDDFSKSQVWTAMSAVLGLLISFRTRQALQRFWEGTSLLHQMRGEWFDSVSCLIAFSRGAKAKKPDEVQQFRQTLVRLTSMMHGSALDEICGNETAAQVVIDMWGLDMDTISFLRDCNDVYGFNKVEALQHMIQNLVTINHEKGVLTIPPPILSRVYQTLSRGLVNLLNAKKIRNTKFPFPWAQIISLLLIVHCLITPMVVCASVKQYAWAILVTFIPVFGMISLNLVGSELEMPFGDDANDLPLAYFQEQMNRGLLLLICDRTDHIATTRRSLQATSTSTLSYGSFANGNDKVLRRSTSRSLHDASFEVEYPQQKQEMKESKAKDPSERPQAGPPPESTLPVAAAQTPLAQPDPSAATSSSGGAKAVAAAGAAPAQGPPAAGAAPTDKPAVTESVVLTLLGQQLDKNTVALDVNTKIMTSFSQVLNEGALSLAEMRGMVRTI